MSESQESEEEEPSSEENRAEEEEASSEENRSEEEEEETSSEENRTEDEQEEANTEEEGSSKEEEEEASTEEGSSEEQEEPSSEEDSAKETKEADEEDSKGSDNSMTTSSPYSINMKGLPVMKDDESIEIFNSKFRVLQTVAKFNKCNKFLLSITKHPSLPDEEEDTNNTTAKKAAVEKHNVAMYILGMCFQTNVQLSSFVQESETDCRFVPTPRSSYLAS